MHAVDTLVAAHAIRRHEAAGPAITKPGGQCAAALVAAVPWGIGCRSEYGAMRAGQGQCAMRNGQWAMDKGLGAKG